MSCGFGDQEHDTASPVDIWGQGVVTPSVLQTPGIVEGRTRVPLRVPGDHKTLSQGPEGPWGSIKHSVRDLRVHGDQ